MAGNLFTYHCTLVNEITNLGIFFNFYYGNRVQFYGDVPNIPKVLSVTAHA